MATGGKVKRLSVAEGVTLAAPPALSLATSHKITDAVTWDGVAVTHSYVVSVSDVPDCREAIWVFKDSNYKQIAGAVISSASATDLTVTFGIPVAAGTYYVIGVF